MEEIKRLYKQEKLNITIENLKRNGFDVEVVENVAEAEKLTLEMIPEGSSISMGGSVTLNMTGLLGQFRSEKYKFFERFKQPTWDATVKVMRESLLSDYLVKYQQIAEKAEQTRTNDVDSKWRWPGQRTYPTTACNQLGKNCFQSSLMIEHKIFAEEEH